MKYLSGKIRWIESRCAFSVRIDGDPRGFGTVSEEEAIKLVRGIDGAGEGTDDDSLGIWNDLRISERTLTLCRRAWRAKRGWTEVALRKNGAPAGPGRPRKANGAGPEESERLRYLRENEAEIARNCRRHGWLTEFLEMRKELHPGEKKAESMLEWERVSML